MSAIPPAPIDGPVWAGAAGAAGAAGGGVYAAGAGVGAAGAGVGAAAAGAPLDLRYSSKEGAEEIDLRGSESFFASGLRVSAIPPAPISGPLKSWTLGREKVAIGEKADAEAARATTVMASFIFQIKLNIMYHWQLHQFGFARVPKSKTIASCKKSHICL